MSKMTSLQDTVYDKELYSTPECLTYVAISALGWFLLSHVFSLEKLVLAAAPDVVRSTLLDEAEACKGRQRLNREQPNDKAYLYQLKNRSAGVFHSVVSVVLSFCCIMTDWLSQRDPIYGISFEWKITGSFVCGYFIWDLFVILKHFFASNDNWQWLLHGLICFSALVSPFFARTAPLAYYAARFVMLEISSPFMGWRWFAVRSKALAMSQDHSKDLKFLDRLALWSSMGFAVMFFLSRIVWGPVFIYIPLMKIFFGYPELFHTWRWWLYVISIPSFYALNIYWMVQIINAGRRLRRKVA